MNKLYDRSPGLVQPRASRGGSTGRINSRWSCLHAFSAAALIVLAACSPPDRPPRLSGDLPSGFLQALGPTEVRALSAGPGLAYFEVRAGDEPWALHLLRVALDRCDLGVRVLKAPALEGAAGGRSRTTELAALGGKGILAAVNGDFFTAEGLPLGTEVVGGEIHHVAARPTFAWRPGSAPWMGVPEAGGHSDLVVGWRVSASRAHEATEALGGFPLLLRGGSRVGDLEVTERPAFAAARHPRTALGYDAHQNLLWVVVVDGRQPGYSEGMTLPEIAGLMEALGVKEALNLDGGGSSVMVLRGVAVSRPSDPTGERPVVNGLGIRRDAAFCRHPT